MKDNLEQIFIVLGKAVVATGHERYPAGEKHGVLAYAKATSHNEAEAITMQQLDKVRWVYFQAEKIGIVDPAHIGDRNILDCLDIDGFHLSIYSKME